MTVFGGKGKYWLVMITLLVIISLVWQLIDEDEQSDFAMHTEIITNSDHFDVESGSISEKSQNQHLNQEETEISDNKDKDKDKDKEEIPVYLVGAVMKPGIYMICPGVYLYQLVDMAGGLTAEAASEQINLAARIYQNQMVRIPTKEEMIQNPDLQYVSEDKHEIDNTATDDNSKAEQSKLININTADTSELEQLPGVGSATALSIISYRQKSGRFNKIEDIMKVSGIKESRFETIRNLITVN